MKDNCGHSEELFQATTNDKIYKFVSKPSLINCKRISKWDANNQPTPNGRPRK